MQLLLVCFTHHAVYFFLQYKYKEAFEKMKGQMIGSSGLEDINISHSVHAALLQSGVSTRVETLF